MSTKQPNSTGRTPARQKWLGVRRGGILLTLVGLLIGVHAGFLLVELFLGHPIGWPLGVLYTEAGLAMALGIAGFGLLVASATPFDESDQAPLLRYDEEPRDLFE